MQTRHRRPIAGSALIAGMILIAGVVTARFLSPGQTAPAVVSDQGPWRFEVTTLKPSSSRVPLHILVRRNSQPFRSPLLRVSVSSLEPPGRAGVQQQARAAGNSYTTQAAIGPASSQVLLSTGSGRHGGKALFALSTGGRAGTVSLYPMLSYRQDWSGSTSVPFGDFNAEIRASPLAAGSNTLQIWLRPASHSPSFPASLQVSATMLDMAMGSSAGTVQALQPGLYVGRLNLSMAGLWRAEIQDGSTKVDIALLAGPRRGKTGTLHLQSGYHGPVIASRLPYVGFVTQMGAGQVALLNRGITSAGQTPHGLDFVAHQPFIYVTDMGDNVVRVLNIRSGRTIATIPVGLAPAHVVFTPDQHRAFVTDFLSADVSVIDVRRRRLIDRIPVGLNPHGIDITPDGREVYVACAHGGGVWIIDARSDRVISTIATGLEPYGLTMGPSGSRAAYVSDFTMNQIDVISLKSRKVVRRIAVGKGPALMVTAPDGRLYVADHDSNSVTAISLATNRVVATVPVGDGPHGLDATPDGRYVYVANNTGNTVSVIDTRRERVAETIAVPGNPNEVALQQSNDLTP